MSRRESTIPGQGRLGETDRFAKVVEYLDAPIAVVIALDPERRSASAYHPNTLQEIPRAGDTPTVPGVLPGFAVPVTSLFE